MNPLLSRRHLLKGAVAGAATLLIPATAVRAQAKKVYPFELPKLPYAFDALEPNIDAKTMEIHHDRHHKAYVDNLNAALKDHAPLQTKTLSELLGHLDQVPMAVRTAVRNNGGGHLNHSMFWQMMAKKGGGEPKGMVAKAIDSKLGGFSKFQEAFTKAAMTRFGSGWAWLVVSKGELAVVSTANQDSTTMGGLVGIPQGTPILGLDVWEHAYYLKYQNKRADYVKAFWNVINWEEVTERYNAAMKG